MLTHKVQRYLLIQGACAGGLLTLAFAPFDLWWLAYISLAWLSHLITWAMSARSAMYCGFAFGLGLFFTGVSWVYVAIRFYGHVSMPLSLLITAVFVGLLSLYPAAVAYVVCSFQSVLKRLSHASRRSSGCIAFPSVWVIAEVLRSKLFTGFPWLLVGYTQLHSPLAGFAPLVGVYGLSFLVAFVAVMIYNICSRPYTSWQRFCRIALIILCWSVGASLRGYAWTTPYKKPLRVHLVQADIDHTIKWQPGQLVDTLRSYDELTRRVVTPDSIVLWPENAVPVYPIQAAHFLNGISHYLSTQNSTVLTGIPLYDSKQHQAFNGLIALGKGSGDYRKRHLVPFGEYQPFLRLAAWLGLPQFSFTPGVSVQRQLRFHGLKLAPSICYETAYPVLIASQAKEAHVLIAVSDHSWFGHYSLMSAQHVQISQMRALEAGKPLLFNANQGHLAAINAMGQRVAYAASTDQKILTATIQPMLGKTPWVKFINKNGVL